MPRLLSSRHLAVNNRISRKDLNWILMLQPASMYLSLRWKSEWKCFAIAKLLRSHLCDFAGLFSFSFQWGLSNKVSLRCCSKFCKRNKNVPHYLMHPARRLYYWFQWGIQSSCKGISEKTIISRKKSALYSSFRSISLY